MDPKEREDWIAKHGREFDVMLSHPKLVSTGLDLFSKVQGGHNYATIVFYETGYNLFDMRQAARRAWRIGQPKDCKVYYLYYRETMQHRTMQLMSRKMAAAQALEGEFSAEGLAAMAGEDNLQMALAKSLAERIDEADMQRSWSKVTSSPKKPRIARPTDGLRQLSPEPPKPGPLDALPAGLQLVTEAIIDSQPQAAGAAAGACDLKSKDSISTPEPAPAAPPLHVFAPEPERAPVAAPEAEDEEGPEVIPVLTEEILARMFANLMDHGMTLADLAS